MIRRACCAVALAVLGGGLAAWNPGSLDGGFRLRGGEGLMLLATACWAWYSIAAQRWLRGLSQLRITGLTLAPGAIILTVIYLAFGMAGLADLPPAAPRDGVDLALFAWIVVRAFAIAADDPRDPFPAARIRLLDQEAARAQGKRGHHRSRAVGIRPAAAYRQSRAGLRIEFGQCDLARTGRIHAARHRSNRPTAVDGNVGVQQRDGQVFATGAATVVTAEMELAVAEIMQGRPLG